MYNQFMMLCLYVTYLVEIESSNHNHAMRK